MRTDFAIVGGGPAGLAAAIRVRQRGRRAVVFEPKPAPIDKACGEGLMPAALEGLTALGVAVEALDGVEFEGIRYRDALDRRVSAEGVFTEGRGRGVRRLDLHRAMRRRAEEVGVEFRDERASSITRDERAVRVGDVEADWLIAADGLHSGLRAEAGLEEETSGPRRYGVRRHFRTPPWTSFVEVHWAARGEAYVTPVGPETVGVAILSEGGGRFDDLFDAFPDLVRRLENAEVVSEDRGAGPFRQRASAVQSGRLLLVGDAAGYVDALTGEGVALAVETASAAVDAAAAGEPERYRAEWRRITRWYRWLTALLVGLTQYRATQRPLIELLDRFPALFDGCLEVLGGRRRRSRRSS